MLDFSGLRNQNAQMKQFKTQKQIALEIGVSEQTYSKVIMHGTNNLNILDKLCKAFECGIQDLVKFKEE